MKLRLVIVTPNGKKVDEEVDHVVVPGEEGELGILADHQPLLSLIRIGELRVIKGGTTRYFACNKGYVEVLDNLVTVMTETCEEATEIDVDRAQQSKNRNEDDFKGLSPQDDNFDRHQAAIQRAVTRISVAQRH